MSKLFAMAVPIIPGKEQQWKAWFDNMKNNHFADFAASRKKHGVRERTFLQHTPMGDMVIITLEGEDPMGAFVGMTHETDEFTKMFLEGAKNAHGIDLTQPPPGPMPEMIIDSHA